MSEAITVGVREFRENLSRYIAEVRDGGAVTITSHGKKVAELRLPAEDEKPFKRRIGGLKHLGPIPEGFDDPDPELEALFYNDGEL